MVADAYQLFPAIITELMKGESYLTDDSSCLGFDIDIVRKRIAVFSRLNIVLVRLLFSCWLAVSLGKKRSELREPVHASLPLVFVPISIRATAVSIIFLGWLLTEIRCRSPVKRLDGAPQFFEQILFIFECRILKTHLIVKRIMNHGFDRFNIDKRFICTMHEPPHIPIAGSKHPASVLLGESLADCVARATHFFLAKSIHTIGFRLFFRVQNSQPGFYLIEAIKE